MQNQHYLGLSNTFNNPTDSADRLTVQVRATKGIKGIGAYLTNSVRKQGNNQTTKAARTAVVMNSPTLVASAVRFSSSDQNPCAQSTG
jgi:hypothetical protein